MHRSAVEWRTMFRPTALNQSTENGRIILSLAQQTQYNSSSQVNSVDLDFAFAHITGHDGRMNVESEVAYHPARVAIRLRAIMAHFGVNKSAFARSIGVTPGAVGNWLGEGHGPNNANIDKIYEVYGVVGEWTLFGRAFALSGDLRGPLTKAEDLIRRSASQAKSAK